MWEAFTRAVYKETVLVWALGLYGTSVVTALVVPQFHEKYAKPTPQNPPTLKEVMAGLQKKLGH